MCATDCVTMTEKRATDHLEPAAKKRGNDRQITKDDESEEEQEVRWGDESGDSDETNGGCLVGKQTLVACPNSVLQILTLLPLAPPSAGDASR